ncbi:NADP-dependent oxidoreductase domain-containing protein [Gorgonomyces haynaldii]|nr:NADP-dependent oxidoreductase domain-containing protein [Gorgonomyces haynaldii]
MEYRHLGNSGLKVSALSLGGWLNLHPQHLEESQELIKCALDHGVNLIDTAEEYADGESEKAIGMILKNLNVTRSQLVVSTKIYWGGPGPNDRGLSRKHIIEGLNASLERLQMDYVDLVFAHRPDDSTPMEEVVRAFNWVIEQGKVFYWGTSEWSAEQITDAHRIAEKLNLIGPLMEQPQYNMFERERFEKEYAPLYKKHGLGTTIFSPLQYGVLTGKYNKGIPPDSRFALNPDDDYIARQAGALNTESGKKRLQKVSQLMQLSQTLGCTVSQLALAWCLKNPNVSSVIIGCSKISQLQENLACLQVLPKLTVSIMQGIELILDNKPTLLPSRY